MLDPISEADVYISYGRFHQAETLIRAAMKANPEAASLKGKLLEIFSRSNNKEAFDAYAAELKANDASNLPPSFWEAVEKFNPAQIPGIQNEVPDISMLLQDNSAREEAQQPPASVASLEPDDSSIDDDIKAFEAEYSQESLETATSTQPTLAADTEESEASDNHVIEFSITPSDAESPNASEPESIHLENLIAYEPETDIQSSSIEAEHTQTNSTIELAALDLPEPDHTIAPKTDNSKFGVLDFKLTLIHVPTPPAQTEPEAAAVQAESSDTNAQEEDLQTRLDLAKTYISMDDKNAARELLQEVSACASPSIKAEAEATLNKLGKVQLTLVSSMPIENAMSEEPGKTTAAR